ncbi:MAG: hypothetical protein M3O07_05090 [Pseudomonadota bacterium]|nr:hypothetical protein [Pseudomonadota bacterium]
MTNRRVSQWTVVAVACLIAFAMVETVGRLFVRPDPRGYGSLFSVLLPPLRLFPAELQSAEARDGPYRGLIVDGAPLTVGDVAGYHRFEPTLGYTTLENVVSVNGWWRSNEIGARESGPTEPQAVPGRPRWLLLGESFAHGSGLPGPQTWPEVIEAAEPALDIVNLAVDGYSMAQAYLRYRNSADRFEHGGAMLMFVPAVDLWRDVNVVRELGQPWKVRAVMPRFVLDGGGIRFVENPYGSTAALETDVRDGLSPTLREHLRRNDRFYFPVEHESAPVIGSLLSFKIAAAAWGRYARGRVRRSQFEPGSEAAEISRRIFLKLQEETGAESRRFLLLVLPTPTDLDRLHDEPEFRTAWESLVAATCTEIRYCVDLAPALVGIARSEIDLGPDGNHYGSRMNAAIANAVRAALPR